MATEKEFMRNNYFFFKYFDTISEYFKVLILYHKLNCNKCHLFSVFIHTSLNEANNFVKSKVTKQFKYLIDTLNDPSNV